MYLPPKALDHMERVVGQLGPGLFERHHQTRRR